MTKLYTMFIGIDPGAKGGLVMLLDDGVPIIQKMPETEIDIWKYINRWSKVERVCVVLEKVGGFMSGTRKGDDGHTENRASAHTMFTFGAGYGGLRMALIGSGFEEVDWHDVGTKELTALSFTATVPITWQTALGLKRPKGLKQPKWKAMLKEEAQRRYPKLKVTLATCDSLLIATYCRQLFSVT